MPSLELFTIERPLTSARTMIIRKNFLIIKSIIGIGNVNAWTTMAYTENFKRFANRRKYGAYSGLVPYQHQSGKGIKGKSRVSHLANKEIKANLGMAASHQWVMIRK